MCKDLQVFSRFVATFPLGLSSIYHGGVVSIDESIQWRGEFLVRSGDPGSTRPPPVNASPLTGLQTAQSTNVVVWAS